MTPQATQLSEGSVLRLKLACDLAYVRETVHQAIDFMTAHGLSTPERTAWELVLAETVNNAILNVRPAEAGQPVELVVVCEPLAIECQVLDHTPGFDWPDTVTLPADDSEHGRGLFIIHQLMDGHEYLQGKNGNCLRLRKNRPPTPGAVVPVAGSVSALKKQLVEAEQVIRAMADELGATYESLVAIFRFSAELSKPHTTRDCTGSLMRNVLETTGANFYMIRLYVAHGNYLDLYSTTTQGWRPLPLSLIPEAADRSIEIRAALERQDVWFDAGNPLNPNDPLAFLNGTAQGLAHPIFLDDQLIGSVVIAREATAKPFSAGQVNVIHTFTDFLALQIVNERFQEEQTRSRVISRELEIAMNIQRSLLPETLPDLPGFGLAGSCVSARQVGGDFYDAIPVLNSGVLLVIADVMGKGIPAALFASILRSLLRSNASLVDKPAALLTWINQILYPDLSRVDMFITAQVAFVNAQTRCLQVANAGHCPLLLACPGSPQAHEVLSEDLPLGITPHTQYSETTLGLPPGSRVLFYTDGLTEARNPAGDLLGPARLKDWFQQAVQHPRPARELMAELQHLLQQFQNQAPMTDDQTFIIIADETIWRHP